MADLKTTADVHTLTGAPLWLIRKLSDRLNPPPPRFRGYRMFGPEDLRRLEQALAAWGFNPADLDAQHAILLPTPADIAGEAASHA